MKALTVAEMMAELAKLSPDAALEVCLRIADDDSCTLVGGLTSISIDAGCTEVPMLMLDGEVDAESLYDEYGEPIGADTRSA
jgi:hypothetical protein